jgi:hypothetical protein
MATRPRYRATQGDGLYWFVQESRGGGIIYDMIETEIEASVIADVLNEGKGPNWDDIRVEVKRRVRTRKAVARYR